MVVGMILLILDRPFHEAQELNLKYPHCGYLSTFLYVHMQFSFFGDWSFLKRALCL